MNTFSKFIFNFKADRLNKRIRNSKKYYSWRDKIRKRDKHCIVCKTDKDLEVDHITPFSLILKRNRILTLRGAFKCNELWDLKNGRLLCNDCHKSTSSYRKKLKSWEKQYA